MILHQNINFLLKKKNKTLQDLKSELEILDIESIASLVALSKYFSISIDHLVKKDLAQIETIKSKNIHFLICDIDGVMTDGGMYYTENGDCVKKYYSKDGWGIRQLVKNGFQVGIISHSSFPKMVENRAKTLGISKVYVGKEPKLNILNQWLEEMKIDINKVAFIGDDLNDLDIMQKVGIRACPADSVEKIKDISDYVLEKKGGEGCVREFTDLFLSHYY